MPAISPAIWLAIIIVVLGASSGIYWYIHNQGAESVRVEQEKELNKLKDRTDAVQDHALTTPTPRDELRKYGRPD